MAAVGEPAHVIDQGQAELSDEQRWFHGPATMTAWGRPPAKLRSWDGPARRYPARQVTYRNCAAMADLCALTREERTDLGETDSALCSRPGDQGPLCALTPRELLAALRVLNGYDIDLAADVTRRSTTANEPRANATTPP